MKNITLAVEDGVLEEVRRYAAQAGTSVNVLVRQYFADLASRSSADRRERERRELAEALDACQIEVGSVTWTREDLHDRHA